MNRCPIHDEPLVRCPNSGEWYCRECNQETAWQAYYAAVDEMYATRADGPERIDWNQFVMEPPF